ncbi:MAG: type II toxin-antitoxin system HicA family toxin [Nocardioidaceae bacterium]
MAQYEEDGAGVGDGSLVARAVQQRSTATTPTYPGCTSAQTAPRRRERPSSTRGPVVRDEGVSRAIHGTPPEANRRPSGRSRPPNHAGRRSARRPVDDFQAGHGRYAGWTTNPSARPGGTECPMPLTVREALKLIQDDGWYLVATRGSHRQFKHPTKPGRVTVAGKPSSTLPPGTERSILRQAGINRRSK